MLRSTLLGLILAMIASSSSLATDSQEVPSATGQSIQSGNFGSTEVGMTTIAGMVRNAGEDGVGGVAIKLFASGLILGETTTEPDGTYTLSAGMDLDPDRSIVLWFVPKDASLAMFQIILHESPLAVEAGIFTPCASRMDVLGSMSLDVTLLDFSSQLLNFKQVGCID